MSIPNFFVILVDMSSNHPTKHACYKVTAYLYLLANFGIFSKKCSSFEFRVSDFEFRVSEYLFIVEKNIGISWKSGENVLILENERFRKNNEFTKAAILGCRL